MRFNSLGNGVHGTAQIFIDGVAVPSLAAATADRWGWLGDDIIAGQADFGGGYQSYQVVVSTDTLSTIDAHGANLSAAGNGVYAAFLAAGANKGVRTNVGGFGPFPLAALGDVSPQGLSAVVQNYGTGTGILTFSAAGSVLSNSTITLTPGYLIRAKDGVYAYQGGGTHIRSLADGSLQSFAPQTASVFQTIPVLVNGVLWVVEVSDQLTARPATSSNGFLITTDDTFNVDAVEVSAGVLRIGWAAGAGESQTNLRMAEITVATGGLRSGTTASGTLVFTTGTTLTQSAIAVGAIEGGTGSAATKQPRQQPVVDPKTGIGTRVYQKWWDTIAGQAVAGPDATQLQGIVDPAHGGTGVTTGLTVLNGGNVIDGTLPLSAIVDETASTLIGRGSLAGSGPEQEITLGSGLTMTGTVLSSSGGASYVPVSTGAEPLVIVSNGAGSVLLTPYTP